MTSLALTAYAVMAVAWTGAAALLIDGWRRDGANAPRSGLRAGEAAKSGIGLPAEETAAVAPALTRHLDTTGPRCCPDCGTDRGGFCRLEARPCPHGCAPACRPHVWHGPVLPPRWRIKPHPDGERWLVIDAAAGTAHACPGVHEALDAANRLSDAARDIARRKDRMEAQWQAAIRRRDDALRGLARHEAADWTGWRPSYDGEDVDPGAPWRPAD